MTTREHEIIRAVWKRYAKHSGQGPSEAEMREILVGIETAPPDPPVSVSERERALVRSGAAYGVACAWANPSDHTCDERIATVDRTHPRPAVPVGMREWLVRALGSPAIFPAASTELLATYADSILARVGPPPAAEDRAALDPIAIAHAGLTAAHAETDRQRARADAAEARIAELAHERDEMEEVLTDISESLGVSGEEDADLAAIMREIDEAVPQYTCDSEGSPSTTLAERVGFLVMDAARLAEATRERDEAREQRDAAVMMATGYLARAELAEGHMAALRDLVRTYVRAESAWRQCSGTDEEMLALDRAAVAAFDAVNASLADLAPAALARDERLRAEGRAEVRDQERAERVSMALVAARGREEGAAEMRERAAEVCDRAEVAPGQSVDWRNRTARLARGIRALKPAQKGG